MSQKNKTAISPTRSENYPEWYQQVIKAADLAEVSAVRGCMVIKPWGYALWENIQRDLDKRFKDTGHVNAYFPLFIPMSYLEKEAQHVEGFAKECAVVTHHRLEPNGEGGLQPAGPLEEPLIVRPTSETIIGETYAKWVQSYRDLPILINQWANVVRWEMRTRMFLRTAEFLWQEGHTVHATSEEAMAETRQMLDVYADFAENFLAMPVIKGEKTADERFPGAVNTFTIEAMMQDKKALQAGTSHFLGQNFSKAQNISFADKNGEQQHAWTTSWGVSTRLIGGLIMTHSDDDGLILPPRVAPKQAVIMPIYRGDSDRTAILEYCHRLAEELRGQSFHGQTIGVEVDNRDLRGGDKAWQHIKKGVPLRMEVGPRDMANDAVFMGRRDLSHKEKSSIGRAELVSTVGATLENMQRELFERALLFRSQNTHDVSSLDDFKDLFAKDDSGQGGFASAHMSESAQDQSQIQELLKSMKVTARCIPLADNSEPGTCVFSGNSSKRKVIFARSY